jgi:hypothetical protein
MPTFEANDVFEVDGIATIRAGEISHSISDPRSLGNCSLSKCLRPARPVAAQRRNVARITHDGPDFVQMAAEKSCVCQDFSHFCRENSGKTLFALPR